MQPVFLGLLYLQMLANLSAQSRFKPPPPPQKKFLNTPEERFLETLHEKDKKCCKPTMTPFPTLFSTLSKIEIVN